MSRIRLSQIFEIPRVSSEKPRYFNQNPWISIEKLSISNQNFEMLGLSHIQFDMLGISSGIRKRNEILGFK